MKIKNSIILLVLSVVILNPVTVNASSSVVIDGNYSDWKDKPSVVSSTPEELALSNYYMDKSGLSLLYEGESTSTSSKIEFENYIETENGTMKMTVNYNHKSQKADVTLYDSNGKQVWGTKYDSGNDKKDDNRQLEISIPSKYLMTSYDSGYNLKIYAEDNSVINPVQIATADTIQYPFIFFGAVLFVVAVCLYRPKNRKG